MLVSILIANYNNGRYIIECLQSVLNQTYTNWQVLILDDKSTDNSILIIKSFIKDDPRFRLIEERENRGVGFAKKKLADLAEGEIATFLDPDDVILPNALELLNKALTENTKAVAAFTGYRICDEKLQNCAERKLPFQSPRPQNSFLSVGIGSIHPLFGFKVTAYRATGGINPHYRIGEDLDLYLKLEEQGEIIQLQETGYLVRRHETSLTASTKGCQSWIWVMRVLYDTGKRRLEKGLLSYSNYSNYILNRVITCLIECKEKKDCYSFKTMRREFVTNPFNRKLIFSPVFYKYLVRHFIDYTW